MHLSIRLATVSALTLLAAGPAGAAIVNGDFETGPFGVGSTPGGWTVSPGNEIAAIQASAYGPCCGVAGSPAELANHFASFGAGDVANVSVLSQAFATVAGGRYLLGFDFGALGHGQQTLFARVFDGATLLGSLSVTRGADNNLATTFGADSLVFVAGGGLTRVEFSVDPKTANVDGVLDNVSVTAAGVPEPAAWALMLAGFATAGQAMRRRWLAAGPAPSQTRERRLDSTIS
jgi:hypothetical protein